VSTGTEQISCSFTLEPGATAGRIARAELAVIEPHVGLLEYENLLFVITELVVNAVKHGPGEPIMVRVSLESGELQGEVEDRGEGVVALRPQPPDSSGGFGLRVVDRLTDEWGVYDGSTHVWFRIGLLGGRS
jgi:anti-sigma regulatory factor (Ser/Thr protein kinase)